MTIERKRFVPSSLRSFLQGFTLVCSKGIAHSVKLYLSDRTTYTCQIYSREGIQIVVRRYSTGNSVEERINANLSQMFCYIVSSLEGKRVAL